MIDRTTWGMEHDKCMVCGQRPSEWPYELQTHEIARGPFRAKALKEPAAWIRTCARCHEQHLDAMPIARQLAIKKKCDPRHYDRVAVNRLRGRQPEAITEDEVDREMEGLCAITPSTTERALGTKSPVKGGDLSSAESANDSTDTSGRTDVNSKRKGKRGELEASKEISRVLNCECHRGQQFKGGEESADIEATIPNLHFEVKRCEQLSIYKAMDQAVRDAGENCPIVLHRRNGKPWLAMVRLDDLPRLATQCYLQLAEGA